MSVFKNEKIWRWLTDIWTVIFIIFLIWDFFVKDDYGFLIAPFSAIYISVLGLYVGTKEFDRWYEFHEGRHPGELFVIVWTVVMFGLFIASFILGKEYIVPTEAVAVYIMVLSVFALTQKSKQLRQRQLTCPPCPYCSQPVRPGLLKKRIKKGK